MSRIEKSSANKVRGMLLHTFNNNFVFRVYDENHNFIDYEIHHADLSVVIDDGDAFFYKIGDRDVIDHSPETLGIRPTE